MTLLGVDYSYDRPNLKVLHQHGVAGIGRYLSHTRGKAITKVEAEDILALFDLWLVWEDTKGAALHGAPQGKVDATAALEQVHALGAPPQMAVYFPVDTSTSAYATVDAYWDAIRAVFGKRPVGGYGSYSVVQQGLANHHIDLGWQTDAWSSGHVLATAAIHQRAQQVNWGAGLSDLDVIQLPHFGGWKNSTVVPVPVRNPYKMPSLPMDCSIGKTPAKLDVLWLQWALGFSGADLDGALGPKTRGALTKFKLAHHLQEPPDLIVRQWAATALEAVHR